MKALYLKAPNQFEVRDVELRAPRPDEVIVKIKACGFCGHDKIMAAYAGEEWQPFGHEFAGVVEEVGSQVTHLKVGDRVAIETSIFDPLNPAVLNGHPEWDTKGPNYMDIEAMEHTAMGFAERTVVPAVLCVPFEDIPDEEACFLEPMGVAADLILTADI
jgi:threonine dehydrogenase-like Zn-dependent dehydrogenase